MGGRPSDSGASSADGPGGSAKAGESDPTAAAAANAGVEGSSLREEDRTRPQSSSPPPRRSSHSASLRRKQPSLHGNGTYGVRSGDETSLLAPEVLATSLDAPRHRGQQRAGEREKLITHADGRQVTHAMETNPVGGGEGSCGATHRHRRVDSSSSGSPNRKADAESGCELSEGSRWGYGGGSGSDRRSARAHPPSPPSHGDDGILCSPQEGRDGDEVEEDRRGWDARRGGAESGGARECHRRHSSGNSGDDDADENGEDDDDDAAVAELLRRLSAVREWVDRYRRAFAPAYPPFAHVLGVVNPLSGENNAASLVERGMLAELGGERVLVLNGAVFANPATLRSKMKAQAFVYHNPPADMLVALTGSLQASRDEDEGDDDRTKEVRFEEPVAAVAQLTVDVDRPNPLGNTTTKGYADADIPVVVDAESGKVSRQESKRLKKLWEKLPSIAASFADACVRQERGTVIISGGDGTVSFIMNEVHLARREIEAELAQLLQPGQPLTRRRSSSRSTCDSRAGSAHGLCISVEGGREGDAGGGREKGKRVAPENARFASLLDVTRYFTMPAVAPIPMGTGNDFSNCVGFGSGFTAYRGFGLCCCCESDVAGLLNELVAAPSIPFDRWTADFIPLRIAQENLRPMPQTQSGSGIGRRPLEPNMANTVHHVDWKAIHDTSSCTSFTITNYLGIGFDAYVTTQFAKARKSFPALCSSRMQNKAVYGVFGIRGGINCRTIRNLLPMVCVPSPWHAAGPSSSSSPSPGAARTTALSAGHPDMVALQLPSSSKALVMTNVSRYSSGKEPWKPMEGELYYRPVELSHREDVERNESFQGSASTPNFPTANRHVSIDASAVDNGVARPTLAAFFPQPTAAVPAAVTVGVAEDKIIPARTATHRPPIITPVAINDRKFELQTMGGVLSYATLGLGLHGSTKMTQTGEMFVFALCTPDDLRYERAGGLCSPYSKNKMAKYQERLSTDARVRASLNVQIDGEAIPRITEPMIVHVYPMAPDRIYVRCRNPAVVRRTAADDTVSAVAE